MTDVFQSPPGVHFVRINADTVLKICAMSETLSDVQRKYVADNALSIAQAYFSDQVWMRAIYVGEVPVGFVMLHIGSDWEDGIDCPGVFLWRFMISGLHQGKGYGSAAIDLLVAHLRAFGIPELYTCYHPGDDGPEAFYKKLGFTPTGNYYGEEPEVVLKLR
jgi:diamine N-acetyltransferase